ncbi:MAG: penicillin-binding protein 2 [Burkholderiales bacterium]|nr:penicillin-binding protein 2 [Burkholderiales bacterium]
MKFAESPVLAPPLPSWRARAVLVLVAGALAALGGRAFYLQGLNRDFLQAKGESRYSRVLELPAHRGRILDRNGEALAISTPVKSIWAIPDDVTLARGDLERAAAALDVPRAELRKRLAGADRDFVFLKRQVPPEVADRVASLGIAGVYQSTEYRRYYPGGEATAQLLGFTSVDEKGQEGVELGYEKVLAGHPGTRRVIKDRRGQVVEDLKGSRPAQEGEDLILALDSRIQSIAYGRLRAAVERNRARAGGIVVLDAVTGELLALANLPTYNPNNRNSLSASALRNRAVVDTFEPGSTLKPFSIAAALEAHRVSPRTPIQTAPGTLTIGPATIRDAHPAGELTVAQVLQKSSNVGAAKIALMLRPEYLWSLFEGVGFGHAPELGFPGEANGKVRPYKTWKPIEQATMSYGHGISVSLMQLARAYTIFARDGALLPLSLAKRPAPPAGQPVVAPATARAVRDMLELAVQPGGTGPRAQIMGYRVAGKTGTAHKQENGAYAADKYVSSFVGLAPASNPRLIVAVMIDEPSAGEYYGGSVAAPVFAEVMSGALRLLGVPPDAPMRPIELPSPSAEIRESV